MKEEGGKSKPTMASLMRKLAEEMREDTANGLLYPGVTPRGRERLLNMREALSYNDATMKTRCNE